MKKLILLIFVVAASLNAQSVQGQIGQVPVVAAADNSPVGGAGNLTTVGSVPYVSASGILNQDAGQFFWDATNNRLGIGTNAPANQLDTTTPLNSGFGFGYDVSNIMPTLKFYRYAGGASTIGAYQLVVGETGASAGSDLSFKSGGYAARGSETLTTKVTFTNTGNVGIGTTAPGEKLEVQNGNIKLSESANGNITKKILAYQSPGASLAASGIFNIGLMNADPFPDRGGFLRFTQTGTSDSGGYASVKIGLWTFNRGLDNGVERLTVLADGTVGIGTTTPVYGLDVAKSGASGTARFYDQTATTGATRVLITLGAADTTSTQVFEIGGLMKFSGLNSTGAGTALLGTNSPAVTNASPYTWLKVLTSDGSTGYVPVWK